MLKEVLVRLSVVAFVCCLSVTAHAMADQKSHVNVPAGDLTTGLELLAKQSGAEFVYRADQLKGLRTRGVAGDLTPKEAVTQLLIGTPLQLRMDPSGAMLIAPARTTTTSDASSAAGSDQTQEGKSNSSGNFLVAQATPGPNQGAVPVTISSSQSLDEKKEILQEVVVTGTHIRGEVNPTAPVTILDRAYIDSTGFTTAAQLLESLPQNFALASQSGVVTPGVTVTRTQGEGVNLRGIGEGTTLVLVDGRRMALGFLGSAADISAIPLSAVERVEVLADGASAIYGSDAVGGVVNFVLRHDVKGAETSADLGWAQGLHTVTASQLLGDTWTTGNATAAVQYYKRDLLRAVDRDFIPPTVLIGSLLPEDRVSSGVLNGRQALTDQLSVFLDSLYTDRDSYNQGGRISSVYNEDARSSNPQINATTGIDWKLPGAWQIETAFSYAENRLSQSGHQMVGGPTFFGDSRFQTTSVDLNADGTVLMLPGGALKMAVGASTRRESFSDVQTDDTGATLYSLENAQRVTSAFAELRAPIVGTGNTLPGVQHLEVSVAGRYDHYSDFGGSFDPQFGIAWEPLTGLRARVSHGTSYVAPKLSDYSLAGNEAIAYYIPDPTVPSGSSHTVFLAGTDVGSLRAQRATTTTAGFDFVPLRAPSLKLSLSYYDITYRDQIAAPQITEASLVNPSTLGSLLVRNPTMAQVDQFIALGELGGLPLLAFTPTFGIDSNFMPNTVTLLLDGRVRNLSIVSTRGVDFSANYDWQIGPDVLRVGLDGAYMLDRFVDVTATSPSVETVGTIYNPTRVRMRAVGSWKRGAWAASAFGNFTGPYSDNRLPAEVPVASWFTVDAQLAYKCAAEHGFTSGLELTLSAQNVFNRSPPSVAVLDTSQDMGFDPTNSNPLGRLVSLGVRKAW